MAYLVRRKSALQLLYDVPLPFPARALLFQCDRLTVSGCLQHTGIVPLAQLSYH